MPSLLPALRLAIVPLIAGLLALSGCGSSHSSSSPSPSKTATPSGPPSTGSDTPSTTSAAPANVGPVCPNGETVCVSQSPAATVIGPKTLSTNLIGLLTRSNPKLKQVKLVCPQASSYPVICPLTGVDTTHGKTTHVKGQVTVMGVYTATHTYSYSVLYAPVPGH